MTCLMSPTSRAYRAWRAYPVQSNRLFPGLEAPEWGPRADPTLICIRGPPALSEVRDHKGPDGTRLGSRWK